jgi:hypothetical protein
MTETSSTRTRLGSWVSTDNPLDPTSAAFALGVQSKKEAVFKVENLNSCSPISPEQFGSLKDQLVALRFLHLLFELILFSSLTSSFSLSI